jgi:hypothetical protein
MAVTTFSFSLPRAINFRYRVCNRCCAFQAISRISSLTTACRFRNVSATLGRQRKTNQSVHLNPWHEPAQIKLPVRVVHPWHPANADASAPRWLIFIFLQMTWQKYYEQ